MNSMKIAFRADASLQIGTGHIMRCLTLADALAAQGAECTFICRQHPGNLIEHIHNKGYRVHALPVSGQKANLLSDGTPQLGHAHWLGASCEQDAEACDSILSKLRLDWLIVDHYSLDARWEMALRQHFHKLMVIDDLADRPHQCELLLDQTFGRNPADYKPWVSVECTLLCGSQYALLRPEFAALRTYSLQRRKNPQFQRLLITMGGVDKDNATGQVLEALKHCELPSDCRITVVMGVTAPWVTEVRHLVKQVPWPTEVRVNVDNMAQLMADSDLAIGSAGATSWERCCLGLPTILLVLAQNQRSIARALYEAGAVVLTDLEVIEKFRFSIKQLTNPTMLADMGRSASSIADGLGVARVASYLEV